MGSATKIEWCDATWNPLRGCTRVNEACRNCYAERQAARFAGPGGPYEGLAESTPSGPRWTGEVRLVPEHLDDPLRWRKPRRIFVNSMSDLFHEGVPDDAIDQIMARVALAPRHTFIVLTKRPERMREYFDGRLPAAFARIADVAQKFHGGPYRFAWPLPNLVLGVSVHDHASAEEFVPHLLATPAACRIVSYEPALGPVDWAQWLPWVFREGVAPNPDGKPFSLPAVGGSRGLDGIIAGGESGPGARPAHPDWFRSTRDQCAAAGVAFFFKQVGAWVPEARFDGLCARVGLSGRARPGFEQPHKFRRHRWPDLTESVLVGKRHAGRTLDGRTHDDLPYGVPA